MEWARVIDVHTYRREFEVRGMFSKCGEIRAIYPWSTGRTDKNHFFIEYAHEVAADRARTEYSNLPDVQVHSLKLNAGMQERFSALSTGKEYKSIAQIAQIPTRPSAEANWNGTWRTRSKSDSISSQSRYSESILMPTPQAEPYQYHSRSRENVDAPKPRDISILYTPDSVKNDVSIKDIFKDSLSSMDSSLTLGDHMLLDSPKITREDQQGTDTSKSTFSTNLSKASTSFSIKPSTPAITKSSVIRMPLTNISLVFSSEVINCDLENFVNDSSSLIALLKESATGRENWIMVAAYYRRKALYESALQVALALQEVMIAEGLQEQDLKPVFLIVSQCHYDIAKKLKKIQGLDNSEADEHAKHAVAWLQRVYGKGISDSVIQSDGTSFMFSSVSINKESISLQTSPVLCSNYAKNSPTGMTPLLNAPKTPSAMRIQTLESEIASLRSREERYLAALDSAHTMKHSIEEEISEERSKRRRVEKRLEDVESELDKTKKLNDFAYEQLKREVESRRKAEDELEKAKRWTSEQEMNTRQRTFKSTLNDLAAILDAAASSPVAFSVKLALRQALAAHSDSTSPSLESK